jgi:polar amino acid transport system substrate-binding protein
VKTVLGEYFAKDFFISATQNKPYRERKTTMFKKIASITLSLLVLVFALGLTACSTTSSNIYTYIIDESYTDYIVMGTSADYPPYEWPMEVDGETTIVGLDIEIAKLIADALGKNLKVINKGFDFLIEDLEAGKVDFVMAGMTPTEERALVVDFSPVYYESIQVVLLSAEDVETYTTIDSMNVADIKIGAQLGAIQQELAETSFPLAQKQYIQQVPDLVIRLLDGQIDGLVIEKAVADGYVANYPALGIASFAIGDPDGGSAVAVQKGDAELLAVVTQVVNDLIASGEISTIVADAIALNESTAE